jgi:hypothetical protein
VGSIAGAGVEFAAIPSLIAGSRFVLLGVVIRGE